MQNKCINYYKQTPLLYQNLLQCWFIVSHLPFFVTIISLVTSLNFLQSSASSRVTLSCFSVGSPFSRPACNSLSTTLSSLVMQQSLLPRPPVTAPPPLLSSSSTFMSDGSHTRLPSGKELYFNFSSL